METLIYIAKAHLLFLILGGIYHFTLKNEKTFSFNRFYLLAIYGVSITAPLLEFKLFKNITFIEASLLYNSNSKAAFNSNSSSLENSLFTLNTIFPWVYGVLVSLSLLIFLIKFGKNYSQFKLLFRFAHFDFKQNVYWIDDDIPPFTFLTKTLLPEKLKYDKNKEIILKHEETHRTTFHFLDIIWVEILSSILIFNPLNKKIKKYIVENHEYLADQYACKDTQKSTYAKLLVQQTLNQQHFQFVSYFAKPTIINRLNMLENNKPTKSKPFLAALSFAFISLLFACDLNPKEKIILKQESKSASANEIKKNKKDNADPIFSKVEEQAKPREGIQAFYDAISEDLERKYPQQAIDMGVEGVVYIRFVIEKDGSLSNLQTLKGIGAGCDKLAVQVLKNYGNWIPAKQKGNIIRSQRVIPIRFVL